MEGVTPYLLNTPIVACTTGASTLVSSGVPLAGMEFEIRNGAGRPLGERRRGRIHVRGPTVMAGYYDLPLATADVLRDGWLDTGDLGFVAGGELFVHGRAKDLIVIRGANHPPDEFEACLDGIEGVRAGRAVAAGFVPPAAGILRLSKQAATLTLDRFREPFQ